MKHKRNVCLIVCIVLVVSLFSPVVSAATDSATVKSNYGANGTAYASVHVAASYAQASLTYDPIAQTMSIRLYAEAEDTNGVTTWRSKTNSGKATTYLSAYFEPNSGEEFTYGYAYLELATAWDSHTFKITDY